MAQQQWLNDLYAAAERAGFLVECQWWPAQPAANPPETAAVDLRQHADELLDGLLLANETVITFPVGRFSGMAVRDVVEMAGVRYSVREVRCLGDEIHARLCRL